ncbi:MAG: DEAD/DEAH box helicase family protein [Candidatus Gastranaerophilales bacterium]|nr:DEAD/DEAH box helicase family protein [Candidatus Gastranaerophilales bacterium]
MTKKVKFEFNPQLTHQINAINSTTALFKGLSMRPKGLYTGKRMYADDLSSNPPVTLGTRVLENLQSIQLGNDLFPDKQLAHGNFAIEMETGTGKTYVYLRTILQSHQDYGFKKFMIIVPSIAIKLGVKKSVEMLADHFKAIFNIDIQNHCFVYDSKNMNSVFNSLVDSKDLSICIINTQAFASDNTKIKNAAENGIILWEELKAIKPIIIIDEPQRVEGSKKKPSQSKKALDELNPLFTLKYSATHKDEFACNFLYKLDSYGAFKEKLVKKIKVKTVYGTVPKDFPYIRYISFTKDLKAKIEIFNQEQGGRIKFKTFDVLGNTSLYELSGKLSQYQDMYIAENPHKEKPLKITKPDGFIELEKSENNSEVNQKDAANIQIRLAIKNHLEKQFAILDKGEKIKALTLFFIDEVVKVRDHSQPDSRGDYLRRFDDEYSKLIKEYENKFKQYADLFPQYEDLKAVRQGYFAIDKNNKELDLEILDDEKEYKKDIQALVDKQIDQILNGKDELISFNSPLSFIFSHSALREGWDNPNVFTLCTLRKGHSDIAKKQEIGRGLRLPVNNNGKRIQDEEINELTVIANDHYDHFASSLQNDFNDKMGFNKDEVTFEIITKALKAAGIPSDKLTQELVNEFKDELIARAVIDDKNIIKNNGANIQFIEFENETLKEHIIKIKESFIELMKEKGTAKLEIENGDNEPIINAEHSYVKDEDFKKILENLKHYMVKRSLYKFNLDKDVFIQSCTDELNAYLRIMKASNVYEVTEGELKVNIASKIVIEKGSSNLEEIYKDSTKEEKTDLDIVDYIMYHTLMPRLAIIRILQGIEKRDLLNYQDVLEDITKKIAKKLENAKANSVYTYEVIDGYELDWAKIIEADFVDDTAFEKAKRVFKSNFNKRKALNKYYKMDSDGEYDFAQKLEDDLDVVLFTKLKKGGFVIDTPYGNYSPDWAVVCKNGTNDFKLYFIIESKFGKDKENLTEIENEKIRLGGLHFRAVDRKNVKFDWIKDYDDYKRKFAIVEMV